MDINTIISLIAMVATVISTIIAFIQVRKCKEIRNEINNIKLETLSMVQNLEQNKTTITNRGTNSGVMAQEVNGGVHIGK
ncbi:hypothetical protein [Bacillus sp. 7504-2]|jgi:hypothetical protein|uniref:hypothetical protein n=1 Tax=Aeribacillus sp. FSL k6-2211 TaxID=2954608 RepID=UPI000BA75B9D|nr:hypothetical protein CHH80_09605 [Bacillus sp. 7504-2]